MGRKAKISLALAILGAGLALAMLFRRDDSGAADQPQAAQSARFSEQPPATPRHGREAASTAPAKTSAALASTPDAKSKPLAPDRAVPDLPPTYQPDLKQEAPAGAAAGAGPESANRQSSGRQRTHKIVDGDTLAALAQRYLGDKDRQGEIHAANRDVLPHPDILPIGLVLKIPPREGVPSTGNQAARAPSYEQGGWPSVFSSQAWQTQPPTTAEPSERNNPTPDPAAPQPPSSDLPLVPVPRGLLRGE